MASPPSRRISNKFRAEPFVNLTAKSLEALRGSSAAEHEDVIIADSENDVVMGDGEASGSPIRVPMPPSRMSISAPGSCHSHSQGPPSISDVQRSSIPSIISDVQRSSIASTASSVSSSARRSSYDPNEPGILEKIHTGQGKSKRKSLPIQQWKSMSTFKIRQPTPSEAAAILPSVPPSIAPNQLVPGTGAEPMVTEDDGNLVFIPEGGSSNSLPPVPPVPRPVPIVVPPASLHPPAGPAQSKPTRKRARKEEPDDPKVQVFYHEDVKPDTIVMEASSPKLVGEKPVSPPSPSPTANRLSPILPLPLPPPAAAAPVAATESITPPITVSAPLPPALEMAAPTETNIHSIPTPTKYDPVDRIFILPDMEPLDRGGGPVKRWTPVYRRVPTIGGGVIEAPTWTSTGQLATPIQPPAGFTPGFPTGASHAVSILASHGPSPAGGPASGSGQTGTGSGGSIAATAGATLAPGASSAGVKRVKKIKSDASLGGSGSGTVSPLSGGALPATTKRKAPAGGTKKGKKTAGVTPAIEPPLVSVSQAVSDVDTEMHDA